MSSRSLYGRWLKRSLLVMLVASLAGAAHAQTSEGNADKDGVVVAKFEAPGGSVSVENGGQAAVSIPVAVPPGVQGMAPSLALSYTSGTADQGLGTGWSLDLGYPDAIRRSTTWGIPNYDATDVFTLGGQDLILLQGSEYRTRLNSFQKVVKSGDTWTVFDKSGVRYEYGATAEHRSAVAGKPAYAYHLSRVVDSFGNAIEFTYAAGATSARLLSAIRYTVNGQSVVGTEQRVELAWQNRTDARRSFTYGGEALLGQRLETITTMSHGQTVRTVELCYAEEACGDGTATPTGIARLAALKASGSDGSALPSRRFRYQERRPGWGTDSSATLFRMPFGFVWHLVEDQNRVESFRAWDTGARLVDVNGDGLLDLMHANPALEEVVLHDGQDGWSPAPSGTWTLTLDPSNQYRFTRTKYQEATPVDMGLRVLDVNGDGLPDLLKSNDDYREIRLNNGSGWDPAPDCDAVPPAGYCFPPAPAGDPWAFNFAFYGGTADPVTYATDMGVRLADVNGDGLPDLLKGREKLGFNDTRPERLVYLNNGKTGWDPAPSWSLPYNFVNLVQALPQVYSDAGVQMMDVNGDGLADVVKAYKKRDENTPTEVWLNNGSGWEMSSWVFPVYFIENRYDESIQRYVRLDNGPEVVDLDGDGYLDIVKSAPGEPTELYLNNRSAGFVPVAWETPVELVGKTIHYDSIGEIVGYSYLDTGVRVADVNGDQLADLLLGRQEPDGSITGETYLGQPAQAELLVEYTSPLGGTSTLQYGQTNGFGLAAGQMPSVRTVAVSLEEDAGLDDPLVEHGYLYAEGFHAFFVNPLTQRRRLDFRGYRRVEETRADGTRREREFYLDDARAGLEKSETLRDSDGKVYHRHEQDFAFTQSGEIYTTTLSEDRTTAFHQDDETRSALRRIEYRDYDEFGNAREVKEYGFDGLQARRTVNQFADNSTLYLSLPRTTERFEGVSTAPIMTELSCYDPGCDLDPTNAALTRRSVTDHRLSGKCLASGPTGACQPAGAETTSTDYHHDAFGRVTEEIPGRGASTVIAYLSNGPQLLVDKTRGGLRTFSLYDQAHGGLVRFQDANFVNTLYEYDRLGRLKTITRPAEFSDAEVTVTYDLSARPAFMRVEQKLDAARTRVTKQHLDGLGRVKGSVISAGANWTVNGLTSYDGRGRAREIYEPFLQPGPDLPQTGPADRVTEYEYEDDSLFATTLPGGAKRYELHDAEAVRTIDENFVVTYERRDAFGQVLEVWDNEPLPGGDQTGPRPRAFYAYDGLGHLCRAQAGLTAAPATPSTCTSPEKRGHDTTTFYDARGLLRGVSAPEGTQSLRNSFRVWNDYDPNGNLTHVWSGNDVRYTEYDSLDRPTNLYLSRDKLASRFAESTRTYDRASNGDPVPNGKGRLTEIIGYGPPSSSSTFLYDPRGRVLEEKLSLRNLEATLPPTVTVKYTYDREGKLTSVTDPRGLVTTYTRNLLGQLDQVGTPAMEIAAGVPSPIRVSDFEYDAAGRVTSIQYGHGPLDEFRYDARGRMEKVLGGPVRLDYSYDLAGNLLNETDPSRPLTLTYGYDRLHRLKTANGMTATGSTVSLTYGYDLLGNLLTVTGTGTTNVANTYVAGTNRLSTVKLGTRQPFNATHDAHGNLTLLRTPSGFRLRSYTYDALGRLRSYMTGSLPEYRAVTASGSVVYDGHGHKVRRTLAGGGTEVYVYTTSGEVLSTYEKQKWTTYLLADGKRLAYADGDGKGNYIHADRLGSARAITVPDGAGYRVAWRGDYFPYGFEMAPAAGADNFRFTGQESEDILGIYDYGRRYYDPVIGRFIQIDAFLGNPQDPRTLNRYSYALNNPLGFVDPTGQVACPTNDPGCQDKKPPTPAPSVGLRLRQPKTQFSGALQRMWRQSVRRSLAASREQAQAKQAARQGLMDPLLEPTPAGVDGTKVVPLRASGEDPVVSEGELTHSGDPALTVAGVSTDGSISNELGEVTFFSLGYKWERTPVGLDGFRRVVPDYKFFEVGLPGKLFSAGLSWNRYGVRSIYLEFGVAIDFSPITVGKGGGSGRRR